MSPSPACAATAAADVYTVYKPRRPKASPLFRLVSDHFRAFHAAYAYLLAFSCKARYFCPSCHAKRLALWTLWLEESLLHRPHA